MTMISESGVVVKSHTKRKRSETTWGFWSFAVRLANDAGGGGVLDWGMNALEIYIV